LTESSNPTPEQVALSLRDSFPEEDFRYIDGWERPRSGTSFLRFSMEPSGRRIVVKSGSGWSAEVASRVFEAQAALARAVSEPAIEHGESVHPIHWIAQPPSIVMPDIGGTDVVSILRDPGRPEWESMSSWMKAAGAMLAAFHSANPAPMDPETREVLDVARRMRMKRDVTSLILERAAWRVRCAAVYGDFGPGNLIGVRDGPIYLIDPPIEPATGPAHRDLGNFSFELRRQLAGHGHTRSDPVEGRFEGLRHELLDGYSERSGAALGQADLSLVTLYEARRAAGMARKRLSTRPVEAVWFARSALARRREVSRAMRQLE
jgi:hypothetical protein